MKEAAGVILFIFLSVVYALISCFSPLRTVGWSKYPAIYYPVLERASDPWHETKVQYIPFLADQICKLVAIIYVSGLGIGLLVS